MSCFRVLVGWTFLLGLLILELEVGSTYAMPLQEAQSLRENLEKRLFLILERLDELDRRDQIPASPKQTNTRSRIAMSANVFNPRPVQARNTVFNQHWNNIYPTAQNELHSNRKGTIYTPNQRVVSNNRLYSGYNGPNYLPVFQRRSKIPRVSHISLPVNRKPSLLHVHQPVSQLQIGPYKKASKHYKTVPVHFSLQPWSSISYKPLQHPVQRYESNTRQSTVRAKPPPWVGNGYGAGSRSRSNIPLIYPRYSKLSYRRPVLVQKALVPHQRPRYNSVGTARAYPHYAKPGYQSARRSYQSFVNPYDTNTRRRFRTRFTPVRTRYRIPSYQTEKFMGPNHFDTNTLAVLLAKGQIPKYQRIGYPMQTQQKKSNAYRNKRTFIPSYSNANMQNQRLLDQASFRRSRLRIGRPGMQSVYNPGYWNDNTLAYRAVKGRSQKRDQQSHYEESNPVQRQYKSQSLRSNDNTGNEETSSNEGSGLDTSSNFNKTLALSSASSSTLSNNNNNNNNNNTASNQSNNNNNSNNKRKYVSKLHDVATNVSSVQSRSSARNYSNSRSSPRKLSFNQVQLPHTNKSNHVSRSRERNTTDPSLRHRNTSDAVNSSSSSTTNLNRDTPHSDRSKSSQEPAANSSSKTNISPDMSDNFFLAPKGNTDTKDEASDRGTKSAKARFTQKSGDTTTNGMSSLGYEARNKDHGQIYRSRNQEGKDRGSDGPSRDQEGKDRGSDGPSRDQEGKNRGSDGTSRDQEGKDRGSDGTSRDQGDKDRGSDGRSRDQGGKNRGSDGTSRDQEGKDRGSDGRSRDKGDKDRGSEGPSRDQEGKDRGSDGPNRDQEGKERGAVDHTAFKFTGIKKTGKGHSTNFKSALYFAGIGNKETPGDDTQGNIDNDIASGEDTAQAASGGGRDRLFQNAKESNIPSHTLKDDASNDDDETVIDGEADSAAVGSPSSSSDWSSGEDESVHQPSNPNTDDEQQRSRPSNSTEESQTQAAAVDAVENERSGKEQQEAPTIDTVDNEKAEDKQQAAAAIDAVDNERDDKEQQTASAVDAVDKEIDDKEQQATTAIDTVDNEKDDKEHQTASAIDTVDKEIDDKEQKATSAIDAVDNEKADEKDQEASAIDAVDNELGDKKDKVTAVGSSSSADRSKEGKNKSTDSAANPDKNDEKAPVTNDKKGVLKQHSSKPVKHSVTVKKPSGISSYTTESQQQQNQFANEAGNGDAAQVPSSISAVGPAEVHDAPQAPQAAQLSYSAASDQSGALGPLTQAEPQTQSLSYADSEPAPEGSQSPNGGNLAFANENEEGGLGPSTTQQTFICKDTNQMISCPPDQTLNVLNADYGDKGEVGCLRESNLAPSGPCKTPGAVDVVKDKCNGLNSCELSASNDVFGDACPDANKYLEVNYDCNGAPAIPVSELQGGPANTQQLTASFGRPLSASTTQSRNEPLGEIVIDLQGLQDSQTPSYYQAPMQQQQPMAYAPQPYPAPAYYPSPPQAALPNLMSASPYSAPNPCDYCNTCSLCATPSCTYCQSTCLRVACGPPATPALQPMPNIPKPYQPLWQQWNEKTADMSSMEMSALIMSPAPKLPSAGKEEKETGSAENSGGDSDDEMDDEDLYDAADKKSHIPKPRVGGSS